MSRRPIQLAALCLLVANSAWAQPDTGIAPPATVPVCEDAIAQRELLRNEHGHLAHFSLGDIAERDGTVLITGARSATFALAPDGSVASGSLDSIAALLRLPDGRTRAFAAPLLAEEKLEFTLPVPIEGNAWGVFMLTGHSDSVSGRTIAGPVYFMTVDTSGQRAIEQIPLPDGVQPDLGTRPSVASHGMRTAIAFPAENRNGESVALLLERSAQGWTSRALVITGVTYVAVAFDGVRGDLVLAVVRPDPRPRRDRNSLFVYFVERAANVSHLVALGGQRGIHQPKITTTPTGVLLTWHRREPGGGGFRNYPVEWAVIADEEASAPVLLNKTMQQMAAFGTSSRESLLLLARDTDDENAEFELVSPQSERSHVRVRVPSISSRGTSAVMLGADAPNQTASQLLVAHPVFLGGGTHLASELLWISTRCNASGGRM